MAAAIVPESKESKLQMVVTDLHNKINDGKTDKLTKMLRLAEKMMELYATLPEDKKRNIDQLAGFNFLTLYKTLEKITKFLSELSPSERESIYNGKLSERVKASCMVFIASLNKDENETLNKLTISVNSHERVYGPILSDSDIYLAYILKDIIIHPFDIRKVGNNSYDVSLGEFYYQRGVSSDIYNPWSEEQSKNMWVLNRAFYPKDEDFLQEFLPKDNLRKLNLDEKKKYIIVYPGETILAHTEEFIGGVNRITTMMKTRSSLGRNFICVCGGSAGMGDVGYVNRWCMEIRNHNPSAPIILPVGARIAQIVFMKTGEVMKPYNSKYQTQSGLEELVLSWNPEMLLPKLYKDTF